MPSTSKKQHNFMAAIANSPKFAKKVGIPMSVGKDFVEADKGKKFRKGGSTNPAEAKIANPQVHHGQIQLPNVSLRKFIGRKEGGMMKESKEMMKKEVAFMKKKGAPKSMIKHEMAEEKEMCYGGKVKKMAAGGMTSSKVKAIADTEVKKHEKRMHGMKDGGYVRAADGITQRGKTKGTMIKMKSGGMC